MEMLRHFKPLNFFICVLSSKVVTVILVPYVVVIAFCSMTFLQKFIAMFSVFFSLSSRVTHKSSVVPA